MNATNKALLYFYMALSWVNQAEIHYKARLIKLKSLYSSQGIRISENFKKMGQISSCSSLNQRNISLKTFANCLKEEAIVCKIIESWNVALYEDFFKVKIYIECTSKPAIRNEERLRWHSPNRRATVGWCGISFGDTEWNSSIVWESKVEAAEWNTALRKCERLWTDCVRW